MTEKILHIAAGAALGLLGVFIISRTSLAPAFGLAKVGVDLALNKAA